MKHLSTTLFSLSLALASIGTHAAGISDLTKPSVNRQAISIGNIADPGNPGRTCDCTAGKWVCVPVGGLHGGACDGAQSKLGDFVISKQRIAPRILPGDQYLRGDRLQKQRR